MARDIDEEIRKEVKGTAVAPRCGFSAAAVELLRSYGIPFKDVDVQADPEKWQAVKTYSDWPTIPQIYIGGEFIGGCDILRDMHARGEIAPLLEKALSPG